MKKYIIKNKRPLLLAILFSIIASIFAVKVQFIKGSLLDYAISREFNSSIKYGIYLGVFIGLELGFFYLYDNSKGRFIVNAVKELREDYFKSILKRNYPEYNKKNIGEYITEYTNEMDIIENKYFGTIPILSEIIIKIFIVSISLFVLDFKIAIVTLVLLTMPLYIPKLVEKKLKNSQVDYIKELENHMRYITDWLNGFEIIKNYNIEENIEELYLNSNNVVMEKNYNKRRLGYITRSISAILSYFSHFIVLIFAGYLVLKGSFSAGDFFIAIGMIDQLSFPIISLSHLIQDIISVKPVNKSILDFINEIENYNKKKDIIKDNFNEIVFENISFGYMGKENILENFNFIFEKNKRYLLRGKSGSGKTTCINLLLNYYNPNSGNIVIDNIFLNEIYSLNKLITIMRQDAILFDDSLRNNIAMYDDIEDKDIIELLNKIGLEKYADYKSLDMRISEGGKNLSGGEKRRITLARAILRSTPILILDEPLANLDDKNTIIIQKELLTIVDKTLIIISHKWDYINAFDKIIEF